METTNQRKMHEYQKPQNLNMIMIFIESLSFLRYKHLKNVRFSILQFSNTCKHFNKIITQLATMKSNTYITYTHFQLCFFMFSFIFLILIKAFIIIHVTKTSM